MLKETTDLYSIDEINESGVFLRKSDVFEFVVLGFITKSDKPLGSWTLQEMLNKYGVDMSLATVGRLLNRLDRLGFTSLISGQGRVITDKGRFFYEEKKADIHRSRLNNRLIDSVRIDSVKAMINLFNARVLLEKGIVRLATQVGKPADFECLQRIIDEVDAASSNQSMVTTLNRKFHIEIAKLTNNPFLITMADILLDQQWKLEAENAEVVDGYQNAICSRYHSMIVKAMIDGDADTAAELMEKHLGSLSMDAVNSIEFKSQE